MAKKHVVATVKQVLTDWTPVSGGKPDIVYPYGDGQIPAAPSPYLFVQFPVANGERTTHSRSFVEEGAARIVIFSEAGGGIDWPLEIGEQLAALFRAKKINGVEFLTPTSPLINDDNNEVNQVKTSVVVPYLYHFDDPDED
ncbi:hypothetical protein [Methylobacterium sp. PvR107]|uniref:hypothetical protein n=1 Tax=Methylobacterium sp. PvR107 TaxID=2806597 RepID=UPI001AE680FB|nr:hypothetical protein [Methylobacterium sp. PvR107]MBP1179971.1 hypothetical protein [Methylobacterium sp. PvR107]